MASSTRKQIFTMHILPNLSRSRGNQALKFGQLIEYSMRNIFLKKKTHIHIHLSFKMLLNQVRHTGHGWYGFHRDRFF